MASPVDSFIPEVWAAELLSALRTRLVYAQASVVNRDYEGDISAFGDTVHVNAISDPTIGDYSVSLTSGARTDITIEPLSSTDQTLTITQSKYFAFEVDDIEVRQTRNGGALMSEAAARAAYKLAQTADSFVATTMKGAISTTNGNLLTDAGALADLTADDAVDVLVDLKVMLDEADVPDEGRWVVVPPAMHGKLLRSDLFVRADASGSTEGLRNGQVGRAFGFDVLMSNQVPTGDATVPGPMVIAGHPMATSYAEQITKVEAIRLERRFADGLRGLHLYGAKVFRPECLAGVELA